jgi:hypothetical protein
MSLYGVSAYAVIRSPDAPESHTHGASGPAALYVGALRAVTVTLPQR